MDRHITGAAADRRRLRAWLRLAVAGIVVLSAGWLPAQSPGPAIDGRPGEVPGRGGGAEPDFESLIDLITSTVKPQTWDDVGGPGSIAPFPTGVVVDAQGVLRQTTRRDRRGTLAALRQSSANPTGDTPQNVRRSSPLRKVSLPRLEEAIVRRIAAGEPITEPMYVLAGLRRIEYVFVYPEQGELVIAGPAGDWSQAAENRILATDTAEPVLRLDDLVVILRHMISHPSARFGCLITPRQENLARLQQYLKQWQGRNIPAGGRGKWLEGLRAALGRQDIEVYGLDPRTRAARVMVEADYRMKLVGMGLEEGVPGVDSYLELIDLKPGESPPPMGVLRWWFTLDYDAVVVSPEGRAFGIRGQGMKVLSENEQLAADGRRVHTGKSEELNRRFARSFTRHFDALCAKYPIYAELRNLGDLALVAALIREHGLAEQASWSMRALSNHRVIPVPLAEAPTEVDTVINHRVVNRIHVIAGVSGGVRVDPSGLVTRGALTPASSSHLTKQREESVPDTDKHRWWWD